MSGANINTGTIGEMIRINTARDEFPPVFEFLGKTTLGRLPEFFAVRKHSIYPDAPTAYGVFKGHYGEVATLHFAGPDDQGLETYVIRFHHGDRTIWALETAPNTYELREIAPGVE